MIFFSGIISIIIQRNTLCKNKILALVFARIASIFAQKRWWVTAYAAGVSLN